MSENSQLKKYKVTNLFNYDVTFSALSKAPFSEPSMDGACLTTFSYLNFTNYSVYSE